MIMVDVTNFIIVVVLLLLVSAALVFTLIKFNNYRDKARKELDRLTEELARLNKLICSIPHDKPEIIKYNENSSKF